MSKLDRWHSEDSSPVRELIPAAVSSQDIDCSVSLLAFLAFFRLREPVATREAFLDGMYGMSILEAESDANCLRFAC